MADIFSRPIQIDAELTPNETLDGELSIPRQVEVIGNYETLRNKPSINDVELTGNKTSSELGLASATHTHTKSDITDFTHTHTTDEITDFPTLAEVATSGDYDDLSNKPNLSEVATSGDYDDLSNKPQINDVELNGNKSSNDLGLADREHTHTVSQITDFPTLSAVATSGSYNDLSNKPNLSTVATSGSYNDLSNKPNFATVATSGSYNDLSNKPNLATVATSGSYTDLTNKPSINGHTLEGDKTAEELGIISQADLIDFGHTLAPVITDTAQGYIVSVTDGADNYPIKSLKVSLQPKQSGTGDPSPDNVRPISGWDEVKVVQGGYDYVADVESGFIDTSGNATTDVGQRTPFIPVTEGNTLYASWKNNGEGWRYTNICYYNASKQWVSNGYSAVTRAGNENEQTLTVPSGVSYVRIGSRDGIIHHALIIQSHSISFPSTVYGGEVDVVSGEGKKTMGIVDLGTLDWDYASGVFVNYTSPIDLDTKERGGNAVCEQYKTVGVMSSSSMPDFSVQICGGLGASNLWIKDSRYTSASDFKTAVNGVKLVYEKKTPIPFTTTPEQISTQLGANTLWSDGEVECEYCCDTKLYIEKKLNE